MDWLEDLIAGLVPPETLADPIASMSRPRLDAVAWYERRREPGWSAAGPTGRNVPARRHAELV